MKEIAICTCNLYRTDMDYTAQMTTQAQHDTRATCLFMLACLLWCSGRMACILHSQSCWLCASLHLDG